MNGNIVFTGEGINAVVATVAATVAARRGIEFMLTGADASQCIPFGGSVINEQVARSRRQ